MNEPDPRAADRDTLLDRIRTALRLKAPLNARKDLVDVLDEGVGADGGFSPEERAMLRNILSLRGKRVDDVMVPRADIIAVPLDITLAELLKTFQSAGHSRLPVYGETLDDPRGMVHIRDFVSWLSQRATSSARSRKAKAESKLSLGAIDLSATLGSVKALTRGVLFVPPSMPAVDLLAKMQHQRTQLALVIDEYGGTEGLVSMEDIVEVVIGDIEDEHDDEAKMIQPAGPGTFTADARALLEDVSEAIGVDVEADGDAADVDTLGGWLVVLAGRMPVRGEIVPGPGSVEFEVIDADPRRVKRVRIHTTGTTAKRAREARQKRDDEPVSASEALPTPANQTEDGRPA